MNGKTMGFTTSVVLALALAFLASPAFAQTTSFAANTLVIPMDTTYQDNGVFLAFGLMDDILKSGIPVNWAILSPKNYGDTDFTASNMVDLYSGSTITTANYAGGPFVIDSAYYAVALPIVQKWQAKYNAGSNVLAVHRATQTFLAPVARTILAAPTLALFDDGNEQIAFGYLNAAAIYQAISKTTRSGNKVTVAVNNANRSTAPTVSSAPAGNSTVTGTSTEAAGTIISLFVNGLYAGDTTVASGAWSYGPTAIPPGINVTATATAAGKGTSAVSGNRASGNLPAGGTSAAPAVTSPIRQGDSTIYGTSSEANGTTIKLFKHGSFEGTTTVANGNWKYIAASSAVGGDTWNATATAPSKTESALSNFVIAVPVPAVTTPPLNAGVTSIPGALLMTSGTVVSVYRTRSSVNTLIGTATLNNGAWSLTVGNTILAAGDQVWATSDTYPFPAGSGTYTCPGTACCADCLSAAQIDGPTTANHADGILLDSSGNPRYCQIMSMHYNVNGHDPEVVAEVRSFLQFQTHAFFECQAVNAFEDDTASGYFLSTNGLVAENPGNSDYYFHQDVPFAQATGPYTNPGGSEPAYTLATGSTYYDAGVVHLSAQPDTTYPNHGHQDEWMSGYIGGDTSKGKVSFLGGHQYTTTLPLSTHGQSQGVRYFLNSLFEAPCSSEAVSAMTLALSGPAYNNGGNSTYTISYATTGAAVLKSVVINMPIPPGSSYVSSTGGGTLSGSTIVWNLGDVPAGTNGSMQFTVSFSVDNPYVLQVSSSWVSGATPKTALSNAVTTIRDTVPPAAPVVTAPANNSSSTNTTPTVTGTAEANSTVKVYVDSVLVGTVSADGSGNWSYTLTSGQALALGAHTVYSTATDAAGNVSSSSGTNNFNVTYAAPVVSSPILAGTSSISGTSTSATGTTITVYNNGTSIGTTTVQAGGTWTLTGLTGLAGGESITATAGTGASESAASSAVIVTPGTPTINVPLVAGQTSVSGTSTAPVGSTVTVYVNGTPYTTTVQSGGTWSVAVPPVAGGDTISVTTTAGGQTSAPTNATVTFIAPVVVGVITPMSDAISGTAVVPDGTMLTLYQDGVVIGTTTVTGGTWSITGISGLINGASVTATSGSGAATSSPSAGVPVSVALLRYGGVTQLNPQSPPNSAIFVTPSQGASLDITSNLEKQVFVSGDAFSHDTSDLQPEASPLVFYQLAGDDSDTLRVAISGGAITITY